MGGQPILNHRLLNYLAKIKQRFLIYFFHEFGMPLLQFVLGLVGLFVETEEAQTNFYFFIENQLYYFPILPSFLTTIKKK